MQPRRYQTRRRRQRRLKLRAVIVMAVLVVIVSGVYAIDAARTAGARKAVATDTPASRNVARTQALESLAGSIEHYIQAHQKLATSLPANAVEICAAASSACKTTALYDANYLVTSDTGLEAIPVDPVGGPGQYGSGYFIARNTSGMLILTAPRAEDGKTITVTR